ncbi:TPA: hypothetical protein N2G45_002885 [Salmonella enterica]|nr:hypothetical protein [Salmonella enterica]HCL5283980.1 hypothetical protein [Salmonella enterica]
MANVIYRGPAYRQPDTVNLQVTGAYNPGVAVIISAEKFVTTGSAKSGRWLILGNNEFMGQDINTAYAVHDTATAYRVRSEDEFNVRLAAGTYGVGQDITIGANGVFKAAASGDVVVASFDEEANRTLSAEGFGDIVIINSAYVK